MNNLKNRKNYLALAGVLLFVFLSAGFVFPKRAEAQLQTNVIVDATATKDQITKKVNDTLMDNWRYVTIMALTTALDTATQTLAKNMATWLASGGVNQGPMAWLKSFGDIAEQSYENAASDFLNTLAVKYTGYGLCQPVNPQITLNIKLGIFRDLQPPKPKCTWSAMINNYDQLKGSLSSGAFLQNFSVAFQPAQNDIDNAIALHYAARNEAQISRTYNIISATSNGRFKDLVSPISGDIKTPASMIQSQVKTSFDSDSPSGKLKSYQAQVSYADAATSALSGIAANAGRMFLNTLANKIVEKYTKGGMFSLADIICKTVGGLDLCKKNGAAGVPDTVTTGANAVALASAYFSSIFSSTPSTVSDFSLVSDLQTCPAGAARNVYNCVIDQKFATALQKQSGGYVTLTEALDQGLIDDMPLIGPNDSRDGLPDCYSKGYCYTNLRKLRRADIIPVGWEIAAASLLPNQSVTLSEVMKGFTDCNSAGKLDSDHPWCHLIDPDWVMKIPIEQCNALVNGQTITSPAAPDRAQTCADVSSCISEDMNGKCTGGYGYCEREKGGWNVNADVCPAQYASCVSFAKANLADNEAETNGAWLTNTLDSGSCNATTAGCRAFAVSKTKSNWTTGTRLYLTSSAPTCEAENAGCSALHDAATTTTQNLIPNPSFETPRTDKLMAFGWTSLGGDYSTDGQNSWDGMAAFHVVTSGGLKLGGWNYNAPTDAEHYSEIQVQPKTLYTLSFYAKGSGSGNLHMKAFDAPFYGTAHDCSPMVYTVANGGTSSGPFGSCIQNMAGDVAVRPSCTTTSSTATVNCDIGSTGDFGYSAASGAFVYDFSLTGGYERYTMTFATSSGTRYLDFFFTGSDYYLDAVQLEASPSATAFHVGGNDVIGAVADIKVPPDYLNCTGNTVTDNASCNNYALVCRETEAGCDGYTPAAGGAQIPGVVSAEDNCPAKCVGYNTFKQEPTQWEISDPTSPSAAARFPKYFIPSTAKTCALADVGCDEFTSLEQAAAGGESKNYFTFLRACRKSDAANEDTFFVWEGSDTAGYQLKSYVLRTGPSSDTRMNIVTAGGDTALTGGPAYINSTDATLCTDKIAALPSTDPNYDPDCREFINASGAGFYRLLSRTITSTDDCKNFRKTNSDQPDCEGTGGSWVNNACLYEGLPAQSATCQATANGCRLFTGNNGANTEDLFLEDFESGANGWSGGTVSNEATTVNGHSYAVSGTGFGKALTTVDGKSSLLKHGKSYTLTVWAKGKGTFSVGVANPDGTDAHLFGGTDNSSVALTPDWQRYSVGPLFVDWTPQAGLVLGLNLAGKAAADIDYFDNLELVATTDEFPVITNSWKTPAECDETADGAQLPQAQLGCAAYTNTEGTTVNIKSFTNLCRDSVIGCKAYIDQHGTTSPFAGSYNDRCVAASDTSSRPCTLGNITLCTIPANGTYCEFNYNGVVPTAPDSPAGASIISQTGSANAPDVFTIPADSVRYLVATDDNKCDASAVGCTDLGKIDYGRTATCDNGATCNQNNGCACGPKGDGILETKTTAPSVDCFVAKGATSCVYSLDPNKMTSIAGDDYRILKPDNFANGDLCTADAVGCDAWNSQGGTAQYFKNPGDLLCEYRTGVTVAGAQTSGWFKKGSDEPCDPKYMIAGSNFGVHRNLDQFYAGFAGVCDAADSGCTEYRDSFDQSVPGGVPYYFLNNQKITDASNNCSGKASNKKGCILFNDQSNPALTSDAAATYADSAANGFEARTPTSTATNDSNIIIQAELDRTCSEWLECRSWETVNGKSQCLSLGNCVQKDASGNCSVWQDDPATALTKDVYTNRPVVFGSSDFTGYSIPGYAPLGGATQGTATTAGGTVVSTLNLTAAAPSALITAPPSTVGETCKSYPETDSPFPEGQAPTGANVCEPSNNAQGRNCECSYRKVSYNSTVEYFQPTAETGVQKDFQKGEIPAAICTDGPAAVVGQPCSVYATGDRTDLNLSCSIGNDEGTCASVSKVDSFLGEQGYCLETDPSVKAAANGAPACLTWLPIDQPNGRDPNTVNFASAGFVAKPGQEMYCAAPLKVCVPNECGNDYNYTIFSPNSADVSETVPPICTELQNANVSFASQDKNPYSLPDGCFNDCDVGDGSQTRTDCIAQENAVCVPLVQTFCQRVGYGDYLGTSNGSKTCAGKIKADTTLPCSGFVAGGTSNSGQCVSAYQTCLYSQSNVDSFCANAVGDFPECTTWKKENVGSLTNPNSQYCDDAYSTCEDYIGKRQNFCAQLDAEACLTNYGDHFRCSENQQNGGAAVTSTFCGRSTNNQDWPSCYFKTDKNGHNCNASNYIWNPAQSYTATGPNRAKTIENVNGASGTAADPIKGCESTGNLSSKFCGDTNTCGIGETCQPVNDFTAHQTEYTLQESTEATTINTGFVPLTADSEMRNVVQYKTIPESGSHTYLTSTGLARFPTVSSDSFVFKPGSGPDAVTGDWIDWVGKQVPNVSPETKSSDTTIGSYPNDLIGMFYLGKQGQQDSGSISIDYDLANPQVLFASQVQRVTFRVVSYYRAGLCRYGGGGANSSEWYSGAEEHNMLGSGPDWFGRCMNDGVSPPATFQDKLKNGSLDPGDPKELFQEYGYTVYNQGDDWQFNTTTTCTNPKDSTTCKVSDASPKDIILTNGNGWKGTAGATEGEMTVSLRLSDSEPKRIIGVHIDATDNQSGGYFYISNVDFRMNGSNSGGVCGEVAYAGSSNPLAEYSGGQITPTATPTGSYGAARTSAIVSSKLFVIDSTGGKVIGKDSSCTPWGAFAIANPATIVTMASGNCEISKGAIYNGAVQLLQVFAKFLGLGILNDDESTKDNVLANYLAYGHQPAINDPYLNINGAINKPLFSSSDISVNGASSGYIAGLGSLKADLKFFASASPDQLPLKNVKIVWDGVNSYDSGMNNSYKNHDPKCAASDTCDPAPFSYSYVYTCSAGSHTVPAPHAFAEIGVAAGAPVCQFTPTVAVTDNWGSSSNAVTSPVTIYVAPN